MNAKVFVHGDDFTPATILDVRRCDSKDHDPRLATVVLHWVDGPIEYCPSCCDKMLAVAAALGVHCHVEQIAPPDLPTIKRAIELKAQA